jgi:hypothetical protein
MARASDCREIPGTGKNASWIIPHLWNLNNVRMSSIDSGEATLFIPTRGD